MKKERRGTYLVITLLLIVLLVAVFHEGASQDRAARAERYQMDPEAIHAALLEYGYPKTVINAMSQGVKWRTYEEEIYFQNAELAYYGENGERLLRISIDGAAADRQEMRADIPEYAFCMALVNGFCYEAGELEYALCSLSYQWKTMPDTRKEDVLQLVWEPQQLWVRDDGYFHCTSQTYWNGTEELVGFHNMVAGTGPTGQQWYSELHDVGWLGIRGVSGAGMTELEPMDGVDSVVVQGIYTHQHTEKELLDTAWEYQWIFKSEIEITWPQGKENAQ